MKQQKIDNTLRLATHSWGAESHHMMVIEECAELIQSLIHLKRGRCTINEVLEELADVTIMCRQLAVDNGTEKVDAIIEKKMLRLEKRIELDDSNLR